MTSPLRFDEKVVLVTGAGNGLGRAYALEFASRGASVVVNDLGGDPSGTGAGTKAADQVVAEIEAKGGKAVANYDTVEEGGKIVQTALDNYGKIDIVVNNAGILRDVSFGKMSVEDWDIIHRVHLRGSFLVTRAAWPHMKQQGFGRIIMVCSSSGIYGNFGQSNYSSAKLGLAGLSNSLAVEGAKYNITCNAVAPVAYSRLTASIQMNDVLKPEYVAPVVAYLCHETCKDTGGLYEVGAGWASQLRWERTEGANMLKKEKSVTMEAVRDNWGRIKDFTYTTHPVSLNDTMDKMQAVVLELSEKRDNFADISTLPKAKVDLALARKFKSNVAKYTYTEKDVALYALGVGASVTKPDGLKLVYEGSPDFSALPTFAAIIAASVLMEMGGFSVPGFTVNLAKVLHGEHYLELLKPLPTHGTMYSQATIGDILDKKSGALQLLNVESFDENHEKVARSQYSLFVKEAGNFGGKPINLEATIPTAEPPSRAPDSVLIEKLSEDQAALYRLNGDINPLHIDPSVAKKAGFKGPILHGLCTFGFAVRQVMAQYAGNDMSRFKAVKVRFSDVIYPGQTLKTEMWKENKRIHLQITTVETGKQCVTGAYVDLHE